MAEHIQQTTKEVRRDGNIVQNTEVTKEHDSALEQAHNKNVAVRIVWYIAGILLVLLALRFVLALLGANPANSFTNFIYTTSHPFVAPFFGVFGYNLHYGVSHFETYTLLAMLIYSLIAFGIARLLTINRPETSY